MQIKKDFCSHGHSLAAADSTYLYITKNEPPQHRCRRCSAAATKRYNNSEKGKAATKAAREHKLSLERRYNFKRYNITAEEFTKLELSQSGVCKICNQPSNRKQLLNIDHDHTTGKVRGLLCWHCNLALGHFKDNVDSILAAAKYLMDNKSAPLV